MFSPDGSKVVTLSNGLYTVEVWDVKTKKKLFTIDHTGMVYSAELSSDGSKVVTRSEGGKVQVWRLFLSIREAAEMWQNYIRIRDSLMYQTSGFLSPNIVYPFASVLQRKLPIASVLQRKLPEGSVVKEEGVFSKYIAGPIKNFFNRFFVNNLMVLPKEDDIDEDELDEMVLPKEDDIDEDELDEMVLPKEDDIDEDELD